MTTTLFFYGTLRHVPLLELILGHPLDEGQVSKGVLQGYSTFAVQDEPFPTLLSTEGGHADGVLVRHLTVEDLARLDFYEGGFQYDLIDVVLDTGAQAQVYICAPDTWTPAEPWDFDGWCQQWAEMSCHAATEVMGFYGQRSRDYVAEIFPQIRARAWSRVLGGQTAAGQDVFEGKVHVERSSRVYTGYFGVDEISLRHDFFDGSTSPLIERSYFISGDASLVLPYDPVLDRVLLVEQMRMGPLGRGDPEIWHLEPIAGRIDPGETPEQAARREATEEASLELKSLETVARGYPSPGDSTGYYHIFVALTDLPDNVVGVAGLANESENIRSRLVFFDDFMKMAERQALANTPLALLAYWLAYHRSRLRS